MLNLRSQGYCTGKKIHPEGVALEKRREKKGLDKGDVYRSDCPLLWNKINSLIQSAIKLINVHFVVVVDGHQL